MSSNPSLSIRPDFPELDTPAVLVDLDIMERNLRRMAELCQGRGVALRPHTKTHKTIEIARRQLELGAAGITVAKLGEAEVMARNGFNDILIAYELIGPHKMRRLLDLLRWGKAGNLKITTAIDSVEGAAELSDAGIALGAPLPVLIEIDSGLGRTGLGMVEEVVSLARHVRLFPGISLEGIMTHEGHIGRDGPRGASERAVAVAQLLREIAEAIRGLGVPCNTVSAGSTPGAPYMAGLPGITELRPGTYVFNDRTQMLLGVASEEDCALTVLSAVVSIHGKRAALDAGTKSLTSDGVGRLGSYGLIIGDSGLQLAACSEEHGHLNLAQSSRSYAVRDRVHILPNHVCPVVNLTDTLYGYRNGEVVCEWKVATRGCVR